MGKGSTQHQYLAADPKRRKKLLEEWLAMWNVHYQLGEKLSCTAGAATRGWGLVELGIYGGRPDGEQLDVIVDPSRTRTAAAS